MAERGSGFDLEEGLRDIGARLAYPPPADLRVAVLARVDAGQRSGLLDLLRSPLSLAPAVATLVLLLAATLAFQPVAGQAAEALGLRGITLFRVPQAPQVSPGRVIPADAARVDSVEAASQRVGFSVRVPGELGLPDEIHVRAADGASLAFLVYDTTPSVLVTELRGSLETQLLAKGIPPGTVVQELEVDGGRGVWIEGEPHQVFYRAPNGDILTDTVRLAGNVLLWERDGLLMRIEAQVDREQALRIARSMR